MVNNDSTSYKIFRAFNVIVLLLLITAMLYPYINVLAKSFNQGSDTQLGGLTLYPRKPTWENFYTLLNTDATSRAAVISVITVILSTFLSVTVQFSAGYGFTKKSLLGRSQLLVFLMIPMYFGGGIIPTYLLYSNLRLLNNFWVYILPGLFSLYNMVIIRTYINTIPTSLEESAKIDGANEVLVFVRIILPLSKPILATVALWMAVGKWNDWTTPLYFITNSRLFNLQYILMQMLKESERISKMIQEAIERGVEVQLRTTPEAIQAAQIVVTTIPIVLVYPFLQKYFIKGIMIGAIKD